MSNHHSSFSELTMLLHLAQSNPSLFQMVSERRTVAMKLGWPKELLEVEAKHRENWVTSYSKCLAGEVQGQRDVQALQEERVKVMNGTNPQYVLKNYIAQNAIEAAENGDFSEVQRLLKVLEKPFSTQPGLEQPSCLAQGVVEEQGEMEQQGAEALASRMCVPHDSTLPSLGQ